MTVVIKELREALVEAGASAEKADAAAAAVIPIQQLDQLATKQDLALAVAELRTELKAEMGQLRTLMEAKFGKLWYQIAGLLIAQAAVIVALLKAIP